jgi:enoyl-CoA hydratase/carnithine racemase
VVPHPPLLPEYAAQAPYNVILVELAEAPRIRMVGNLVTEGGAPLDSLSPDRVRIGARVQAVFDAAGLPPVDPGAPMTVRLAADKDTGVAVVTVDRPTRLNAIDLPTVGELNVLWRELRFDDTVRAIVLTGAGGRAFSTGLDRDAVVPQPDSPYMQDDPLLTVGPKANDLWKPVVAAVEGMACGGAFYLLGESEFIGAGADPEFFDPHTAYGMVSAYESVLLAQRMPYGEVARMMLMGTAERISARRAYEIGLVSELTEPGGALAAATACAAVIAGYPPTGVQGTVRALWAAKEAARGAGWAQAPHLIALGNLPGEEQAALFAARPTSRPRIR